jgi:hypothetical protein
MKEKNGQNPCIFERMTALSIPQKEKLNKTKEPIAHLLF